LGSALPFVKEVFGGIDVNILNWNKASDVNGFSRDSKGMISLI
tara:strand:- start:39 stop:167 length:129 start_codon:yes stop_codon:yes gene_type:complete